MLGLNGLYYSHDFSRHGYARNLDHHAFLPFWDKIAALKLPAFVELSATPNYDKPSYIANLMALDRLMQRHSTLRFVLVMGPPVAHFGGAGRWDFPPEVLAAYKRDNLLIEIMFPITWGGVWEYPYPEAQKLIDEHEPFNSSLYVAGGAVAEELKNRKLSLTTWENHHFMEQWEGKIVEAYGFPKGQ